MSADMTSDAAAAATGDAGRRLAWPGGPETVTAADIDFEALSHVLANTCRWGGRTRHYHALAAHALVASEEIEALDGLGAEDRRVLALHALLMVAPAAWLGPGSSPGQAPGAGSQRAADRTGRLAAAIERAVREAAGLEAVLSDEHAELLRFIARMTAAAERRDLFDAGEPAPAPGSGPGQAWAAFPPLKRRIRPVGPGRAAKLWLARFRALARPPGAAGLKALDSGSATGAGNDREPNDGTNDGEDSHVADVSAKEGPEKRARTPAGTPAGPRAPGGGDERKAA